MRKRIDIKSDGFMFILFFMFTASFSKVTLFVSLPFSIVLAVIIGFSASKECTVSLPKGIITLLMFQNFCIGMGAHLFANNSEILKYVTQIPFMVLSIIFFILFINGKIRNTKKQTRSFIFLLFAISFSFFVGRGSFQSILINIRNLITFYLAYSIGKLSIKNKTDLNSFIKYLFKIALIFLIAGIILLLGGYNLYKIIGIKEVYKAKGAEIIGDNLDDRFYTTLYKTQFVRMGSLLYEPVNLAYFYSLTFILSLFYVDKNNIRNKTSWILINGIGLFLTFGKGGYLISIAIMLLFLLYKVCYYFNRINNKEISMRTAVIIGFTILVLFSLFYYKNIGAAANTHFLAIELTWKSILNQPYGYGIGTGGNMATLFNKTSRKIWLSTGGETALMSFIYQLGIQGGISLIICLINLKTDISRVRELNDFLIITYFIPYVLIGISLLQDNTFTPQCIVAYMFILGCNEIFYDNLEKEIEE